MDTTALMAISPLDGRYQEKVQHLRAIFSEYGLTTEQSKSILDSFEKKPDTWVDFMMRHELNLEEPDAKRASRSALTIAISYIIGGIIPLAPYVFIHEPHEALLVSLVITLLALFVFGYIKSKFVGTNPLGGAIRTAAIGGLAAGAAYWIAKLIS